MTFKRVAAAALTVAGLAGIGALTAPAQAATGYDRCPDGRFCIFTAPDGGGRIAFFHLESPDLRIEGVDGEVYSLWNRTSQHWIGCTEYNYQGNAIFGVTPGYQTNIPSDVATQVHSVKPS